ncbi:TLDc domain-containing protein [Entamoeba marina]
MNLEALQNQLSLLENFLDTNNQPFFNSTVLQLFGTITTILKDQVSQLHSIRNTKLSSNQTDLYNVLINDVLELQTKEDFIKFSKKHPHSPLTHHIQNHLNDNAISSSLSPTHNSNTSLASESFNSSTILSKPQQNSSPKINDLISFIETPTISETLKSWCGHTEYKIEYDSSIHGFKTQTLNEKIEKKGNILFLYQTNANSIFGSYHTVPIPFARDRSSTKPYFVNNDQSHFVFTLQNPSNYPPSRFFRHFVKDSLVVHPPHSNYNDIIAIDHFFTLKQPNELWLQQKFPVFYNLPTGLSITLFTGDCFPTKPIVHRLIVLSLKKTQKKTTPTTSISSTKETLELMSYLRTKTIIYNLQRLTGYPGYTVRYDSYKAPLTPGAYLSSLESYSNTMHIIQTERNIFGVFVKSEIQRGNKQEIKIRDEQQIIFSLLQSKHDKPFKLGAQVINSIRLFNSGKKVFGIKGMMYISVNGIVHFNDYLDDPSDSKECVKILIGELVDQLPLVRLVALSWSGVNG